MDKTITTLLENRATSIAVNIRADNFNEIRTALLSNTSITDLSMFSIHLDYVLFIL